MLDEAGVEVDDAALSDEEEDVDVVEEDEDDSDDEVEPPSDDELSVLAGVDAALFDEPPRLSVL